jgi:hypothetical protein
MSCCTRAESDRCLGSVTRVILWVGLLALGGVVVACLPEIKRYAKISTM